MLDMNSELGGNIRFILLILNILVPIIVCIYRLYKVKGIQIDHVVLFSVGFYFYWITPIILGLNLNRIMKLGWGGEMGKWYNFFNNLPCERQIIYLMCTLSLAVIFYLGDLSLVHKKKGITPPVKNKYYYIPLVLIIIMAIVMGIPLLDKFFTGYKESALFKSTGEFTSASIVMLSIALLYVNIKKIDENAISAQKNFFISIVNPAFLLFIIMCILLSSLGTRSIVIAGIVIYISLYSCYYKHINILYLIILFILLILISHFIILFRIGAHIDYYANYRLAAIAPFLLSDTLFINFSLLDYLSKYEIEILNIPYTLLSYFIGIVPTIIFPNKADYYVTYKSLGYDLYLAQGTVSSFVSFIINFGILGSGIFLFIFGKFMSWLKYQDRQPYITMYVMICGWMAFAFFRTFELTVVKLIIQFSIIIPFIMYYIVYTLTKYR